MNRPGLPLAVRVVEVIADRGEAAHPRYRYGSGCVVAGRTVLTAAHVVKGAVSVKVRDPGKVMHEAALDPGFVGDVEGSGPDLALVEIADPAARLLGILWLPGRLRTWMGGLSLAWPPDHRCASRRAIDSSGLSTWAL